MSETWRPPFCPDPTGCRPLIHPLTDSDNMALDQRGFAVFCFGKLSEPLVWTFDDVEHVETLSTCQSSPLKGVVRWLENEADWSALLRSYRAAIAALRPAAAPAREDPARDEFAWLIERGQPEKQVPTVWWADRKRWGLTYSDSWTEDANKAFRFETREAAEAFIESHTRPVSTADPFGRAVEHGFIALRPAAAPAREGDGT